MLGPCTLVTMKKHLRKKDIYFVPQKITFVAIPCKTLSPQWSLSKLCYTPYFPYHSWKQTNPPVHNPQFLIFWYFLMFSLISFSPEWTGFFSTFAVSKALWKIFLKEMQDIKYMRMEIFSKFSKPFDWTVRSLSLASDPTTLWFTRKSSINFNEWSSFKESL